MRVEWASNERDGLRWKTSTRMTIVSLGILYRGSSLMARCSGYYGPCLSLRLSQQGRHAPLRDSLLAHIKAADFSWHYHMKHAYY